MGRGKVWMERGFEMDVWTCIRFDSMSSLFSLLHFIFVLSFFFFFSQSVDVRFISGLDGWVDVMISRE